MRQNFLHRSSGLLKENLHIAEDITIKSFKKMYEFFTFEILLNSFLVIKGKNVSQKTSLLSIQQNQNTYNKINKFKAKRRYFICRNSPRRIVGGGGEEELQ